MCVVSEGVPHADGYLPARPSSPRGTGPEVT